MSLGTAHQIFIAGVIALFVFYASWELRHLPGGGVGAAVRGLLSALGALALIFYLRRFRRHSRARR